MRLIKLKLENFKGVKFFELNAQGDNLVIYGQNGSGKTTLFDAFTWALFNKDSENNADFDIKTRNEKGEEIHNIDHSVTLVLDCDGTFIELKKIYQEKWTKKRDSVQLVFEGHQTKYFVDGVPTTKTEYDKKVKTLMDEKLFKLLTNPAYFNVHLSWQEQRQILLDIVGGLTDEEIIAANPLLKELPAVLKSRSMEDAKKVILATRSKINEELREIPARIDELSKNMPDRTGLDVEEIFRAKRKLAKEKETVQQQIVGLKNGTHIINLQKRGQEIELAMLETKKKIIGQNEGKLEEQKTRIFVLDKNIFNLKTSLSREESMLQQLQEETLQLAEEVKKQRELWHQENEKTLDFSSPDKCPTCRREYPEEYLQSIRLEAEETFNLAKAQKLEAITNVGRKLGEEKARKQEDIAARQQGIAKALAELAILEEQLGKEQKAQAELAALPSYELNPSYQMLQQEKEKQEKALSQAAEQIEEKVAGLEAQSQEIDHKLAEYEAQLATLQQALSLKKRIAELEEQEKNLAAEYEVQTKNLKLLEEFISTKVSLLTDKINSKFKYVEFKLLDRQVDGTLIECCQATVKGARYGKGLNFGARVNAGLDIINVLSEHYGRTAPIWIDNSESITEFIPVKAQIINLVASKEDRVLRVEKAANTEQPLLASCS